MTATQDQQARTPKSLNTKEDGETLSIPPIYPHKPDGAAGTLTRILRTTTGFAFALTTWIVAVIMLAVVLVHQAHFETEGWQSVQATFRPFQQESSTALIAGIFAAWVTILMISRLQPKENISLREHLHYAQRQGYQDWINGAGSAILVAISFAQVLGAGECIEGPDETHFSLNIAYTFKGDTCPYTAPYVLYFVALFEIFATVCTLYLTTRVRESREAEVNRIISRFCKIAQFYSDSDWINRSEDTDSLLDHVLRFPREQWLALSAAFAFPLIMLRLDLLWITFLAVALLFSRWLIDETQDPLYPILGPRITRISIPSKLLLALMRVLSIPLIAGAAYIYYSTTLKPGPAPSDYSPLYGLAILTPLLIITHHLVRPAREISELELKRQCETEAKDSVQYLRILAEDPLTQGMLPETLFERHFSNIEYVPTLSNSSSIMPFIYIRNRILPAESNRSNEGISVQDHLKSFVHYLYPNFDGAFADALSPSNELE